MAYTEGTGVAYDWATNPIDSMELRGFDAILQNITNFLGTSFNDRARTFRPGEGSNTYDLLQEPLNTTTVSRLKITLYEDLNRIHPDVEVRLNDIIIDINDELGRPGFDVVCTVRYRGRKEDVDFTLLGA